MLILIYTWMFLILVSAAIWRTIPPFKNMLSPFSSSWKADLWKMAEEEVPEVQLLPKHQVPPFFALVTLINWICSPVITVLSMRELVIDHFHQRKLAKFIKELNKFIEYLEETCRQYREERTHVTSREIAHILKEFTDKFESRWGLYPKDKNMDFDTCVAEIMQDLMEAAKGKIKFSELPFPR